MKRAMHVEIKNNRFPSFKERRVQNDALMVPDKGFTKQLHALDRELEVVWDWGAAKWEIWRFPEDGREPFHMMTVQTQDRTYRELGADILVRLQKSDPSRYTLNELVAYFDELDNQIERRKRKQLEDTISAISSDVQQYARGVLQVQVPRWYMQSAVEIKSKPNQDMYIDIPKEQKIRRAIANG